MMISNDTGTVTSGLRKTIFDIRRDKRQSVDHVGSSSLPYKTCGYYKGEWKDNQKSGYGAQVEEDGSRYEGTFQANKYHGRGTLWKNLRLPGSKVKRQVKVYAGQWSQGKMHGEGVYTYPNGSVFTGEFAFGKRSGTGRLETSLGETYNGGWQDDQYNGMGWLRATDGNIYEGYFINNKKEGPGCFYYASSAKIYEGEWSEDAPRCGVLRDATDAERAKYGCRGNPQRSYLLPECGLADPSEVLSEATTALRVHSAQARGLTASAHLMASSNETETQLGLNETEFGIDNARQLFYSKSQDGGSTVALSELGQVFAALGCPVSNQGLSDLAQQLEIAMDMSLTFAEVAEIATYIRESNV